MDTKKMNLSPREAGEMVYNRAHEMASCAAVQDRLLQCSTTEEAAEWLFWAAVATLCGESGNFA